MVPLLFKCNRLLWSQVLSILLLFTYCIPLAKKYFIGCFDLLFKTFIYSINNMVSCSLIAEITFLTSWNVFTLFDISFVPVGKMTMSGFLQEVGLIWSMTSSVVAPRWLLVFTELTRDSSRLLPCFIMESSLITISFFHDDDGLVAG